MHLLSHVQFIGTGSHEVPQPLGRLVCYSCSTDEIECQSLQGWIGFTLLERRQRYPRDSGWGRGEGYIWQHGDVLRAKENPGWVSAHWHKRSEKGRKKESSKQGTMHVLASRMQVTLQVCRPGLMLVGKLLLNSLRPSSISWNPSSRWSGHGHKSILPGPLAGQSPCAVCTYLWAGGPG